MKRLRIVFLVGLNLFATSKGVAPTIFVPRQLSYNPIFENALTCSLKVFHQDRFSHLHKSEHFLLAAKPIYTQNVGSKFAQYFTINNKPVLNVQENGTGDISSLWFQTLTQTGFYSSGLSFTPKRKTVGMMLYALLNLTEHISFCVNTALINTRNTMNIFEKNLALIGEVPGLQTITSAFSNSDMQYGAINGIQSKSGVDDIQVKFVYHSYASQSAHYDSDTIDMYHVAKSINKFYSDKHKHAHDQDESRKLFWEVYALAGIPTGAGSQAQYLFEPLVGSRHAQIGLGGNLHYNYGKIKFQAEAKWRYAFAADEMRSFDLTKNGQWSRYMLFVNFVNKMLPYPAINNSTFLAQVIPQNSFDLYCAAYWDYRENWHYEIGYDFWIRQAEKIAVSPILPQPSIGMADLYNISRVTNPQSASTANISQGVITGQNTAPSDTAFVAIQPTNFNLASAAAPQSISNSIYASIAYSKEMMHHVVRTGLSLAYECGHGINVPNNLAIWLNLDVLF